ncbi:hypothetical protein Q5H92_12345 [Hymenobacter sp. M29]|uniref:PH domain-containing protein n=1 Tax=Hymenobacter mellowenesis TaxID=3063995 RepID=A0ABT9ABC2_9BACT|nr:hypothetical protein [Hymenobacter sp. M29]MDO7847153.1 hypothetical protein [Hymenobacter sp. M29]
MQAFLRAFDGQSAHVELLADAPQEAGWLEALEQGLVHNFDSQLRSLVNAALAAAGHGAYRMQVYKGRGGPHHVFTVGPAPRPSDEQCSL